MEYVKGETLEQIIMREGALDLNRALDYTCQICNAVDHAHRAGVLHRDLRPATCLSRKGAAEGDRLRHLPLSRNRRPRHDRHRQSALHGPEQFHGKAVFASDVYSVGVTMYQMLTGELPYDTPAPADIERLMRGELVTSPRLKNSKIPQAISDIILRALDPELTARYQRASELLNDTLAARGTPRRKAARKTAAGGANAEEAVADIHSRLRARETPSPDSAGSAASRCMRAPTNVRSAVKASSW
jgi:serine/threonine-protein kinase